MAANNNFDVFEDRAKSLLERWRKFVDAHPDAQRGAIQGFLLEINDDFTKALMEKDALF